METGEADTLLVSGMIQWKDSASATTLYACVEVKWFHLMMWTVSLFFESCEQTLSEKQAGGQRAEPKTGPPMIHTCIYIFSASRNRVMTYIMNTNAREAAG